MMVFRHEEGIVGARLGSFEFLVVGRECQYCSRPLVLFVRYKARWRYSPRCTTESPGEALFYWRTWIRHIQDKFTELS